MVLVGAQPRLEVPPLCVEELLGPWLEAQERHLVRREVLGADPIVEACERALHDRGA